MHREAVLAQVDEDQRQVSAARKLLEEAEEMFATADLVFAVLNGGRSAQSQSRHAAVPPSFFWL